MLVHPYCCNDPASISRVIKQDLCFSCRWTFFTIVISAACFWVWLRVCPCSLLTVYSTFVSYQIKTENKSVKKGKNNQISAADRKQGQRSVCKYCSQSADWNLSSNQTRCESLCWPEGKVHLRPRSDCVTHRLMEKQWRFFFTHCTVYTNCLDTNCQTSVLQ